MKMIGPAISTICSARMERGRVKKLQNIMQKAENDARKLHAYSTSTKNEVLVKNPILVNNLPEAENTTAAPRKKKT